MIDFIQATFLVASCLVTQSSLLPCVTNQYQQPPYSNVRIEPTRRSEALDVVLTAEAALVWDQKTGVVLYDKNGAKRRPVASLTKLLTALTVRSLLPARATLIIPKEVEKVQAKGADVGLPVGHHASVADLLKAGLVASANDAMVALAIGSKGSEDAFVAYANEHAQSLGLQNTYIVNATGLSAERQYSTAYDIKKLLSGAANDPLLAPFLTTSEGVLSTTEGSRRAYKTTNKLLGTYLPIDAAKTGYTNEAGENLAILTHGDRGEKIGVIILGSTNRWQDMKTLVEWIWRNYTWNYL